MRHDLPHVMRIPGLGATNPRINQQSDCAIMAWQNDAPVLTVRTVESRGIFLSKYA